MNTATVTIQDRRLDQRAPNGVHIRAIADGKTVVEQVVFKDDDAKLVAWTQTVMLRAAGFTTTGFDSPYFNL